jgi:hypothetical protein
MKAFLIIISVALLLLNFINTDINPELPFDNKESFNPALGYINSPEKLEHHVDSIASSKDISIGSYEYVQIAESVIKKRFYHGFSHFSLSENWVAALSGRFVDEGLACKVKPEDILEHSNAACSQQSIVLMALLYKKNISYRKIGFPHHYAMEVMADGEWFFCDPNMEPTITKKQRMESSWNLQSDALKKYYDKNRYKELDYQLGVNQVAVAGPVNEVPARNIKLFHTLTFILSKLLWCLPLLLLYFRPAISFSPSVSFSIKRKHPKFSFAV